MALRGKMKWLVLRNSTHLSVVFLLKDRGQISTQAPRISSGNVTCKALAGAL